MPMEPAVNPTAKPMVVPMERPPEDDFEALVVGVESGMNVARGRPDSSFEPLVDVAVAIDAELDTASEPFVMVNADDQKFAGKPCITYSDGRLSFIVWTNHK
jgi:hypothetical protein